MSILQGKSTSNNINFTLQKWGISAKQFWTKKNLLHWFSLCWKLSNLIRLLLQFFMAVNFYQKKSCSELLHIKKRICIEALLLSLLYHTLKELAPSHGEDIQLLQPEKLLFHLVWLGDEKSPIFWKSTDELQKFLDTELTISVKENLQFQSHLAIIENTPTYPLQIQYCNQIDSSEKILTVTKNHIFLYGSGGMGKSFLLQHQKGLYLPLSGYQKEIQKAVYPDVSCWILVQILLKYHYQCAYPTYELCCAFENEKNLLKQLSDLLILFQEKSNYSYPEYTILLDGFNEISAEKQDLLAVELHWICEHWKNVRLVVSGRNLTNHDVFFDFDKIKLLGISEKDLNQLLPHFSDYPKIQYNQELLELLRTPLFLNLYLESQCAESPQNLNTRGEILENYVNLQSRSFAGYHAKMIEFIIQYILPFVARKMTEMVSFEIDRADLSRAVMEGCEFYLMNEQIYQNFTAPLNFRKKLSSNLWKKTTLQNYSLKISAS